MPGERNNTYGSNNDGMLLNKSSDSSSKYKSDMSHQITTNSQQTKSIDASVDQDDHSPKDKAGLFDGISKSQVLAGALASVTSMLLSSKIGIAGSVIGVAVGSVVSTVASTVYKNILRNSANALKNSNVFNESEHDNSAVPSSGYVNDSDTVDKTIVDIPMRSYLNEQDKADVNNNSNYGSKAPRIAPDSLLEKNAERHKKQIKVRMIMFSVVASLIAVAVTAILINVFTNGDGIGQKTEPIITPRTYVTSNSSNSNEANSAIIGEKPRATDNSTVTKTTNANGTESANGESTNDSSPYKNGASSLENDKKDNVDNSSLTGTKGDSESSKDDTSSSGSSNSASSNGTGVNSNGNTSENRGQSGSQSNSSSASDNSDKQSDSSSPVEKDSSSTSQSVSSSGMNK